MNEHEAHAQRMSQIREVLPSLLDGEGRSCLYVGATPHRFQLGKELHDAGYRITLLEIDPDNAYYYGGHPWLSGGVLCGDVRDLEEGQWDTIVWWHGPEHIDQADLGPTLCKLEAAATRLLVLAAPLGENFQPVVEGNAHQEHKAHLQPADFERLGYCAVTCGAQGDLSTWPHILAWKAKEPGRVIYSAVFGGYDEVRPIRAAGFRTCLFSDTPILANGWENVVVERRFEDARREARMYKALAHQWFTGVSASLWMDGNAELLEEPGILFACLEGVDIALPRHPSSRTLADEAALIVALGKADERATYQQLAHYDATLPVGATAWLLRRHNEAVRVLNEAWWAEMTVYTLRDQLSLPHCLQRLGIQSRFIDVNLYDNQLVRIVGHGGAE